MSMTPRKLFKIAQSDLNVGDSLIGPSRFQSSSLIEKDTKSMIKAILTIDSDANPMHVKLLSAPAFRGCYPTIQDQILTLGRYATDAQFTNDNGGENQNVKVILKVNSNANMTNENQTSNIHPEHQKLLCSKEFAGCNISIVDGVLSFQNNSTPNTSKAPSPRRVKILDQPTILSSNHSALLPPENNSFGIKTMNSMKNIELIVNGTESIPKSDQRSPKVVDIKLAEPLHFIDRKKSKKPSAQDSINSVEIFLNILNSFLIFCFVLTIFVFMVIIIMRWIDSDTSLI